MDAPRPAQRARRLPILALLSANAISVTGNAMTSVAVPWLVLQTTGSAARAGLTGAAIAIGVVLAGFLGGPLVDRLGFRRTSVLSDVMSGSTVALVALLYLTDVLAFWQLLSLVFLGSVLDAPGTSARRALIPDLAREAGMPLERANSADAAIPRLALFLGPPLAGVLIAAFGVGNVLWLDAATFGLSAALVAAAIPRAARPAKEYVAGSGRGYLAEVLEGLRFVRGNALILSMFVVVMVGNLLDGPLTTVVMPVLADRVYGSAVSLGLMLGGFGAGALSGTVAYGFVGHRLPRRATFAVCFAGFASSAYLTLAFSPPLPVAVGALALAGFVAGPLNPLISTVIQENVPRELRGRVFGVLNALGTGGVPLGMASVGFLVEGFGASPTLLCMGAVYLTVTFGVFLAPPLRRMDAPEDR